MNARSNFRSKAIMLVLLVVLTLALCVPVAAATNSTTLTTTVPETFPLLLELSGNGTVMVNGVAYTQSGTVEIPRNATVVLQVTPDAGNEIASVIFNDLDYTSNAKNGQIIVPNVTESATMRIVFSEIPSVPTTGDLCYHVLHLLTVLMVVSLMVIISSKVYWKK